MSAGKRASDRSVGLVFAAALAAVALAPVVHGGPARPWPLAAAAAMLTVALIRPRVLSPVARLWLGLGDVLGEIASPIAMLVLFASVVVPTRAVLRALGKDPLRRRFDATAETYWVRRPPPGPDRDSMRRQF